MEASGSCIVVPFAVEDLDAGQGMHRPTQLMSSSRTSNLSIGMKSSVLTASKHDLIRSTANRKFSALRGNLTGSGGAGKLKGRPHWPAAAISGTEAAAGRGWYRLQVATAGSKVDSRTSLLLGWAGVDGV
jgi:hypothetical protein